jgi:hypothetical protein
MSAAGGWKSDVVAVVAGLLVCASAWYLIGWSFSRWVDPKGPPSASMLVTRTRLTRWLANSFAVTVGFFAVGSVLAISYKLMEWVIWLLATHPWGGAGGATALTTLLAAWKMLPTKATGPAKPLALQWGPLLSAVMLAALLMLGWGIVAAWLVGDVPGRGALFAALTLVTLTLVTGETFQFLNLSTIQNLYTARIVRAYLGASNAARLLRRSAQDMTEAHTNDDMTLDAYHGTRRDDGTVELRSLAPIHLINVTINETVAPQGSLVNQDRKGLPLAVTPDGFLVDGVFHPRAAEGSSNSYQFEPLSVGRWVGISGAAFAPGLGRGTRPELSALMVLGNVRLGYWWKVRRGSLASRWRTAKRPFATQLHLFREMRGSFRGTNDNYWYLSDGGHFENTGVYELLRRRLDFILALDNGADQAYQFGDIANLMRLASVDLGACFSPITSAQLAQSIKGKPQAPLAAMLGDPNGFSCDAGIGSHFLLAYRVTLPAADGFPAHTAVVLWVKPRLTEQTSLDIRQYQATHRDFPQESTADQFFDDEQWESYRKLGEHTGQTLFDGAMWNGNRLKGLIQTLFI